MSPVPKHTNEAGHFRTAFAELVEAYPNLFDLVSYDAGGATRDNADAVIAAGKHYLFRLKDERRLMTQLAHMQLDAKLPVARTEDRLNNATLIVRELWLATPLQRDNSDWCWPHTRTLLKVRSTRIVDGVVQPTTERDERYFAASLAADSLTAEHWLAVVRGHWGVENNTHHTLDTAFGEDDHPYIEYNENGFLVVAVVRRIALSLLALFRSVTQRSEEKRAMPWKHLLAWVHDLLIAANRAHLEGLRMRPRVCP